jgi:hypothetical protein
VWTTKVLTGSTARLLQDARVPFCHKADIPFGCVGIPPSKSDAEPQTLIYVCVNSGVAILVIGREDTPISAQNPLSRFACPL